MANKKLEIMELRKILRLHQQGRSDRFIADYLGISRNTVSKYLELSKISGYSIDRLVYSSHRLELKGESFRKQKSMENETEND